MYFLDIFLKLKSQFQRTKEKLISNQIDKKI